MVSPQWGGGGGFNRVGGKKEEEVERTCSMGK